MAASNNNQICEQAWDKINNGQVSAELSGQIAYWKSLSGQCAGTGMYEYRLSNLYMQAGQYQAARAELESALKRGLSHKRELWLGMADLGLGTNNLSEARKYAERIMRHYPDWFAGYQEMGEALVMGEKFKEGIPYLLKANRIQEAWPSYRTLAIAYFYTNQDEQAIAAVEKAIGINRALMADPQLMVLTAKAYMKVGKPKIARGALITLANNDPAIKSNPTFIKLYHTVESALQGH